MRKMLLEATVLTAFVGGLIPVLGGPSALATPPANGVIAFAQVPVGGRKPCTASIARSVFSDRYAVGTRLVLANPDDVADSQRIISGFASATDPSFSFDGTRLVFAGQKFSTGPLQVWIANLSDLALTLAFECGGDCVQPAFLPDGGIVFASTMAREYEEHGGRYAFSLYRIGPGETTPTRITFNPSSDTDPVVLDDGRILFASWQHVGNHRWPTGVFSLMTVNSDGTGIWGLTGNHSGDWLKRGATLLGGDRIGFVSAERMYPFSSGALLETSLNDPFAAYEVIVDRKTALVADAAVLDDALVAAALPGDGSAQSFGLYRVESGNLVLIFDDPDYHELLPATSRNRRRPPRRISVVDDSKKFAWLAALNCYKSDVPGRSPPRPGEIASVRVLEGVPVGDRDGAMPPFKSAPGNSSEPMLRASSGAGGVPIRILGEVPVEQDGSFYVRVPADVPLRLQLLDRDGFNLVDQRAWFWLRPGERRVCIGCHENRELAPPNIAATAIRKPPVDLTDPANWRTISFRRDLEAGVIANKCSATGCHRPPEPTAGMNLSAVRVPGADAALAEHFGPAYASLLRRRPDKPFAVGSRLVHPGDARSSPLMWMLYGRPLAPQYSPAPFERALTGAHPDDAPLDEKTLELFRTWIDLGAHYDDKCPAGVWSHTSERTNGGANEAVSDSE